ncbi:MAG: polysaccharide deacetylase family protein [Saprospiraceae bacterium]|nr:polysaccharide deacetylase family protein [Saprospiraceae bacterium]
MYPVRIPKWVTYLYPHRLWHKSRTEKKLYLSFDDGPIPEITPWVLEQLDKYNAKASFFCVGENVEKHTDIYQQILEEGHQVGNHTQNHLNGWKTPTATYLENVAKCQKNVETQLFRPPYGKLSRKQAKILKKNYTIVMWDVLSGDFDPQCSSKECLQNVLRYSQNGSIIVFHDNIKAWKSLQYTLPRVLEHYRQAGYQFCAL